MAQFVVRDLEEEVKARLKRRAKLHGRSMEEEIRHILRNAAKESSRPIAKIGSRIAARFANTGLETDLPELRCTPRLPAQPHRRRQRAAYRAVGLLRVRGRLRHVPVPPTHAEASARAVRRRSFR